MENWIFYNLLEQIGPNKPKVRRIINKLKIHSQFYKSHIRVCQMQWKEVIAIEKLEQILK